MSLATTQMLSQHLATMSARLGLQQRQIQDLEKTLNATKAETSVGDTPDEQAKRESQLADRVESSVRKALRTALTAEIREAIARERQVVEDKIVQSVSVVADDIAVEIKNLTAKTDALSLKVETCGGKSEIAAETLLSHENNLKNLQEKIDAIDSKASTDSGDVAQSTE